MKYKIEDAVEDKEYVTETARKCWEEVDQMNGDLPYDLDWDLYKHINDSGMLRYYTVWTDDDEKVGFAAFLINKSLHNKGHFLAVSDCMYIEPKYRGCGEELLSLIIKDMKQEGVSWFSFNVKEWLDKTGTLGKNLGCRLYEHVYQLSLI